MDQDGERDFGAQPIAEIMREHELKPHDLVCHSTEQISHKMIARAMKGRRLTTHVQLKILHALNKVTGKEYERGDLFNYK